MGTHYCVEGGGGGGGSSVGTFFFLRAYIAVAVAALSRVYFARRR